MNDVGHANEDPIVVEELVKDFSSGRKRALDGAMLRVPKGCVFGLVGANGAGKTTLIKHLLGLLAPTSGSVRVFGLEPMQHPVAVLSRLGYLSEDRDLPGWMRVGELIGYTAGFYPAWDDAYAEELRVMFNLDRHAKIKHLSRGEKAKAGLLIALAYRPELLLLDEPSSGLDPVVRRDMLAAIIRAVASEGRTVLFSSHLLDEIERVSDHVAMIHQGKVVLCGPLEEILAHHHRVVLRFDTAQPSEPAFEGLLWKEGGDREWMTVWEGPFEAIQERAGKAGARILERSAPTLEEVFVAHVGLRPAVDDAV